MFVVFLLRCVSWKITVSALELMCVLCNAAVKNICLVGLDFRMLADN